MKKISKVLIILLLFLLIVGCKKEDIIIKIDDEKKQESKEVGKIDKDLDYIYLEDYTVIGDYILQLPKVNLNTADASTVNLELKTFISNSYSEFVVYGDSLNSGNIIENKVYEYNQYVSLDVMYYYMVDGMIGDYNDMVYVFNIETGKLVTNEEILRIYDLSEYELYSIIEDKIDSIDSDYIILNIKNDGYKLFVDNDNCLRIVYYERNDFDTKRKELVLD